jgi:hypothetical protein
MRNTSEIKANIDSVKEQMNFLRGDLEKLTRELVVSAESEFESEKQVKRGDKIISKGGETYFYDGFVVSYGSVYMLCHPAKKDGTASKAIRHFYPEDFEFEI